jgi:tight adherence protein B
MTFLAVTLALLMWPRSDPEAARIVALRADHRLAPLAVTGSPLGFRRPSWPAVSRGRLAVGGAVALFAVVAPSRGGFVAAEFAVALCAAMFAAVTVIRDVMDGRGRTVRAEQTMLALALVTAELDAGSPPATALSVAAASGSVGVDLGRAVAGTELPLSDPLARVAAAWALSMRTGTPLVDLLLRVRRDLADGQASRRAVGAAVAGPQASAAVLALLPVLGIALGSALGANPVGILFATGAGRVLLALGVLLDAAGVLWTLALIRGAQR